MGARTLAEAQMFRLPRCSRMVIGQADG